MSINKRILYCGGISEEVDEKTLHAAFIPFGDIIDINIPIDFSTQKHRGFAFIEYESAQDASFAIDNMNDSEIFGKTIRVNIAKPIKLKEGSARPVWSEDSWLLQHAGATLDNSEKEKKEKKYEGESEVDEGYGNNDDKENNESSQKKKIMDIGN